MHKIFAKTLFLGKNVVFLPHCHSTNEEAKKLSKSKHFPENSLVYTDFQEKGRGQQGNAWISEREKNLLFTIYLKPENLIPSNQFRLNIVSSLAVAETLRQYLPHKEIQIKWPNDIYCGNRKIGGILIETVINGGKIEQVYCGIGINVNQLHFAFPSATSMVIEMKRAVDREVVLEQVLCAMEKYLEGLNRKSEVLEAKYLDHLRWKNELRLFRINGEEEEGTILGIDTSGKLIVKIGNNDRLFDVKEIEFIR